MDISSSATSMPRVVLRDRRTLAVQVLTEIRNLIKTGQLTPGDRLPSEAEFAEMYGVGRTTIREAVKTLEHDGLVESQPGRGRFVAQHARALLQLDRPLSRFQSISSLLASLGYQVENEVLSQSLVSMDAETALALGCDEGEKAVRVDRLRRADGQVLVYSETYVNVAALGVPTTIDFSESILVSLDALGHKLSYAASEISAVALPERARPFAGDAAAEPWLLIEEVCMSEGGLIMLISKDYYLGAKFTFNMIRRGDGID